MYLVTGGAGFIGSHTAALAVERGLSVRVLDNLTTGDRRNLAGLDVELVVGDITDAAVVRAALAGVTHVVHLAARPGVPDSVADPVDFDRVNVHGTAIVFEEARRAAVTRVVYASSAAVYGSDPTLPKSEDLPIRADSPYGANKVVNEIYADVYRRTMGLSCVGLRYFNVFGERQDPRGPYAAVVPRFVEMALAGRSLTVFGDGEQTRDFVAVRDVARANLAAAVAPTPTTGVYNVGTGRGTSVNALASYVREVVADVPLAYRPERPGDIVHSRSSIERAEVELGWRPEADFDEAMSATVAWYRDAMAAGRFR